MPFGLIYKHMTINLYLYSYVIAASLKCRDLVLYIMKIYFSYYGGLIFFSIIQDYAIFFSKCYLSNLTKHLFFIS